MPALSASPAYDSALRLLGGRARSRQALERALARRGFPREEIEAAISRVAELGYVDDARYARARAEILVGQGRWAPPAIVARLVQDGLREPEAQEAVEAACVELGFDLLATGRAILQRRRLAGVRAARFLQQRGFPEDAIAKLVPMDARDE